MSILPTEHDLKEITYLVRAAMERERAARLEVDGRVEEAVYGVDLTMALGPPLSPLPLIEPIPPVRPPSPIDSAPSAPSTKKYRDEQKNKISQCATLIGINHRIYTLIEQLKLIANRIAQFPQIIEGLEKANRNLENRISEPAAHLGELMEPFAIPEVSLVARTKKKSPVLPPQNETDVERMERIVQLKRVNARQYEQKFKSGIEECFAATRLPEHSGSLNHKLDLIMNHIVESNKKIQTLKIKNDQLRNWAIA